MNPTDVYIEFVLERHRIWARRQLGLDPPWTTDPVLASYRFTNVFRVLDVGSQFLVKDLLYSDEPAFEDALMRCFMYRYTNRPEPWQAFERTFGRHPLVEDLEWVLPTYWRGYRAEGFPIFGNAFKMFSGAENKGTDRLSWMLNLGARYFHPDSPDYIVDAFRSQKTTEDRVALLKTIPRCADFMGMQIVTDMGYGPYLKADENEWVVAGPGAIRGAKELGMKPLEAIDWAQNVLLWMEDTPMLGSHPLSLMDLQNTLCEFSKYARYMSIAAEPRPYQPRHPGAQPEPFIPPHW